MRKTHTILCALCLALLIPLLARARRALPVDTAPLVAEKYAGWCGVLRLWVFEGWPCGDGGVAPWLNECVARFERRHAGTYVQPTFVDAGAIATMNDSGIARPDLILFPPGLLDAPTGLAALKPPENLRRSLAACGVVDGVAYALPVAVGGYAWAIDPARLTAVPADWRDAGATLAAPTPERYRRWDVALAALCAHPRADAGTGPSHPDAPGLDLGLASPETPAPTAAPTAGADSPPRRLPDGFDFAADALRDFVNGDAAATPVTQREVRRLQSLSARGMGRDWRLATGCAFTDLVLCVAVPEKPSGDPRAPLCEAFARWLLSDECQSALHLASAFSATDAPVAWSVGDPLARMDAALRDEALLAPNVFDAAWRADAENIVRDFIGKGGDMRRLWDALARRLGQYPNNPG